MYKYLGCVRSTRRLPSCANLLKNRFFNTKEPLKDLEQGTVSNITAYYDHSPDKDSVLNSFMQNLRKDESRFEENLLKPNFDQIKAKHLQKNLDLRVSLFSKDIVNTYNLFTTCLRANDLDRAETLLTTMYTLITTQLNKTPMIDAFNSYFLKWTQDDPTLEVDQITRWFSEKSQEYSKINFDDRTYAILIESIMSRSTSPQESQHKALIRMYMKKCNKQDLKALLSHADIFKLENLKVIVTDFQVPKTDLPEDIQEYFQTDEETLLKREEEAKRLLRQFSFEKDELPELEKNSDSLKPVDTFGLKVIRHSIMALATKSKSEMLADFATKLDSSTPVEASDISKNASANDIDFFSIYKSLSPEDKELFSEALEEFNYERQLLVETNGIDSAKEKWRHDYEQLQKANVVTAPANINHFLYQWQQELSEMIKKEVSLCQKLLVDPKKPTKGSAAEKLAFKERLEYAPFISLISPEKMAVITIMEVLKNNSTRTTHMAGLRTSRVVLAVGSAIETEYNSQERLKATENRLERQRLRKFLKLNTTKAKIYLKRNKINANNDNLDDPLLGWTHEVQAKLGSVLVSFLLQIAKLRVTAIDPVTKKEVEGLVPAFYHSFQYVSGTKVGVIKLQNEFAKKLSKDAVGSIITPQGLPMLVKPRPWTSFKDGGYLTVKSLLLRSRGSLEQTAYLRAASENGQLQEVYDGLNVLGETSWTVNKQLYKIIAKVWNTGKQFLEIPGVIEEPEYPEKPPRNSPPEDLRNWKQEVQRISNEFGKARSMRCDTNYKLEIARAFLGEKFYFPHNLDFRGRAYPLSPHFNHLGNDLTRSLLMFWEGKELGENGLTWLKVHISNLFGIDKVSLLDRVKFADEHIEQFKICCADPLSEEGSFWKTADKPWQALATMYELTELIQMEDPSKFVSHQPIHQDGTCNGLQHYAALGGDIGGARQVNLIPQEKPADVYSYVAGLVQDRVDLDADKGVEEAIKVQKHIKRKVVKQTIMTNVYGVTFVGARDQIAKQLDNIFTDRMELSQISSYLTKQVFASIRELFENAHLIQDWLTDAAKIISKSFYIYEDDTKETPIKKPDFITTVVWTTPLGLPIVQPYRSITKRQVKTNLQTVYISDPYIVSPVDSKKQQNALPPNFVHSLDATHMLKSAVSCGKAKISFAAVHDSYWTHASDVETMNGILRSEFVKLYQIDIIKGLKEEFEKRYADYVQVVPLRKESAKAKQLMSLKQHLGSLKDSKMTLYDELFIEVQRRKLLRSDNPEDVKIGKEIVTTISFMEDYDFDEYKMKNSLFHGMQVLAPFKLPDIPKKGDLDVECVKDSPYFFS